MFGTYIRLINSNKKCTFAGHSHLLSAIGKKEWVYRHIWNEGGEKNCKKLKAIKLVWTLEKIAKHYRGYILHFDA